MLALEGYPSGVFVTWVLPLQAGSEVWEPWTPRGTAPNVDGEGRSAFDYDPTRDRFVLLTDRGTIRYLLPSRNDELPLLRPGGGQASPTVSQDGFGHESPRLEAKLRSNPARGVIHLLFSIPPGEQAEIRLCDVRGRVHRIRELAGGTQGEVELDAQGLGPGMYFLRVQRGGASVVRKFVLVDP
jgi:hypothetical protein